uniref:Estradiol 17-beta-dehydrogenase 8 n=1 Tax=Steinernema glaseri TaxID=37863 RepID=A0A1I7ZXS8_9BILA
MPHAWRRTVLITGSTDGPGRQAALELASHYDTNFVVVHGKTKEKCQETVDYIVSECKIEGKGNVDFVVADFSDLKQVGSKVKIRVKGLGLVTKIS